MQNFTDIPSSRTLSDSLIEILNNDKTAISCNSGTTFPTTNLQIGMLCYRRIQVVLKHELYGRCLRTVCRVFGYGSSLERIVRHKAVHVNPPVSLQFLPKFWSQRFVPFRWKIA